MDFRKIAWLGVMLFVFLSLPLESKAFSLGVVTDLHAGDRKSRKQSNRNIVYPRSADKYLKNILRSGFGTSDVILTLGDNIQTFDRKYIKQIQKRLKGRNVLWTRGNHDSDKTWKYFNSKSYYSYEKDNWKIIVLYTGSIAGVGSVDADQLAWLAEELKTEKKVLVSMHAAMYDEDGKFYSQYSQLKEMLEKAGVKYVFSGHVHAWEKTITENGITYKTLRALTLKGGKGYYMSINLD